MARIARGGRAEGSQPVLSSPARQLPRDAPPERERTLSSAFGRVAEFVLHRGHRDITQVTLAGADRDARRCLCIAARALHLALSCEGAPSRSRLREEAFPLARSPPTSLLRSERYFFLYLSFFSACVFLLLSLTLAILTQISA